MMNKRSELSELVIRMDYVISEAKRKLTGDPEHDLSLWVTITDTEDSKKELLRNRTIEAIK
jgi:hypothetical protein